MQSLEKWEDIIKEKKMKTSWRNFVKQISSWRTLTFHNIDWLISRYPKSVRIWKIITSNIFAQKRDKFWIYWRNYDFDQDFFKNFQKLFLDFPHENVLLFSNNENSEYSDQTMNTKNAYLSIGAVWVENVFYSISVKDGSLNVFNSMNIITSENVYFWFNIINSNNIFYCKHIENCSNIWFCTSLIWCHDCIFCEWLENTSYYIKNKSYEKEQYFIEKQNILSNKNNFLNIFLRQPSVNKSFSSTNVIWKYIANSTNIKGWYYLHNVHTWKNLIGICWGESVNIYDTFMWAGLPQADWYYWIMWCWWGQNVYNSCTIPHCSNVHYCYRIESCSFCIWCIWLINKSYCILNKQYTKKEYFELADKIFSQMDKDWILWEFFPAYINPFYFNDTAASLLDDSFSKEEMTKEGFLWRDEKIKVDIPEWTEIINIGDLDIINYGEEILKKVIMDQSWNYYRIVRMEYDFLKKYNLPLPEIHWLDRIKLGFKFN